MASKLPKQTLIFLPELFELLEKQETRMDKQNLLIQYAQKDNTHESAIRHFMELMWHPAVHFDLPEGTPPYAPATDIVGEAPTSLFRVFKAGNISRCLKGSSDFIPPLTKRETYFISFLEQLEVKEGELLIAIKDAKKNGGKLLFEHDGKKKNLYPSVTCDLFCQVFGGTGWLPQEVVVANPPVEGETKKQNGGTPSEIGG